MDHSDIAKGERELMARVEQEERDYIEDMLAADERVERFRAQLRERFEADGLVRRYESDLT